MRRAFGCVVALMALALSALVVQPASAAVTCQTGVPLTGTVQGPVIVPAGAFCEIGTDEARTFVNGSITVQPGGTLQLFNATVNGSVSFAGAVGRNSICRSTITGNLSSTALAPDGSLGSDGRAGCDPITIGGNGSFTNNRGTVSIVNVSFGNNLSFTGNTGGSVQENRIGNVLSCSGNNPPPFVSRNTARIVTGQCVEGLSTN